MISERKSEEKVCIHIRECGAKDNGTGLCWACAAHRSADEHFKKTDWKAVKRIVDELRRDREDRQSSRG